jgi:hypothetical protein
MEDIDELLEDACRGIDEIQRMHDESVAAGKIVSGMRARIKSVLEHQRSVLDYLVRQVNGKYCKKPPKKSYYPLGSKPEEFNAAFDRNMPGVRKAHPEIAEAFARYQPYIPGPDGTDWLRWLTALVNGNKHNQLTPQTQQTDDLWRHPDGGAVSGIAFVREGEEPTTDPTGFFGPCPWTKETIFRWAFVKPDISVMGALLAIQGNVVQAAKDIRQAADL